MTLTEELLTKILERLTSLDRLTSQSPWLFPISGQATIFEDEIVGKTLNPGERCVFIDRKTSGWFHAYNLTTTSPKVRASVKLYQPAGAVMTYSIIAEELHAEGLTTPPANATPYCPVFDPTVPRFAIYVTPPFPGESFSDRITAEVTNEDVIPTMIIFSRWSLFELRTN
ncbi:hypothetical protein M1O47_00790 [Dehalococcoidia bacterium]|nr:hypothetical protein [Dehalococcoidia bacterium]